MSNRITEANDQGQRDGSIDRNSSSSFADFVGSLISFGFLGPSSHYDPPSDPDEKEAYDSGYRNTLNQ
jgi:hypothetical protein